MRQREGNVRVSHPGRQRASPADRPSGILTGVSEPSERALRASRRANWPGSITTLAHQADAAIVREGTPGERVAMVWRVTLDVWASSGRPMPSYARSEMPGRVIRSDDG